MEITRIDFADGLKTKNLKVEPMIATVAFVSPPKEFLEAVKKDKLVVQNITNAVFEQLKTSRKTVQSAITDFDSKFVSTGDKKKDEDAVAAFNTVCKQICTAQQGLAEAAAEKKWKEYVSRNKAWVKMQIKFACKITMTTIGLALSIASAAASHGATAVAVIGMANKLYTIGKEIYEFAKDIDKVEKGIVELATALSKKYSDPKLQKMDWKDHAQEVAAILGVPFVKGTATLEEELKKHKAKIGQLGSKAESAYSEAKKVMVEIAKLEKTSKGTKAEEKVKKLGKSATTLLDKVAKVNKKVEDGELFNETMKKMNEQFIEKRNSKLGPLKKVVEYASEAQEVLGFAKEILDFAKDLAV